MASNHFHQLTIASVEKETENAICVWFEVPEEHKAEFGFIQGQYLTLRATIGGEEVRRSYSICSGVDDGRLRVAIKRVEGGVFSTWANESLRAGMRIDVMPPQGSFFTVLDPANEKNYLCISAGSGITPILSIIRTTLAREPKSRVTLIYGNQRTATMMFRNELCFIKNRYLERFQWINIFSREPQEAGIFSGHINNRKGGELNRRLIRIRGFDSFFLCGPEAMISEVSRGLRGEGIDESQIHYELFAASAEEARQRVEKHHARARDYQGLVSEVTVISGGRQHRFELTADGENILDAGLENGADLPFSCKGGVCATCKARLVEGEVDMDLATALEPDEIAAGYILTCQSHPVSDKVIVDFDQSSSG
jgi:ring-1,2-phenylacetyl-CoA epoxidase subunit PaaE